MKTTVDGKELVAGLTVWSAGKPHQFMAGIYGPMKLTGRISASGLHDAIYPDKLVGAHWSHELYADKSAAVAKLLELVNAME